MGVRPDSQVRRTRLTYACASMAWRGAGAARSACPRTTWTSQSSPSTRCHAPLVKVQGQPANLTGADCRQEEEGKGASFWDGLVPSSFDRTLPLLQVRVSHPSAAHWSSNLAHSARAQIRHALVRIARQTEDLTRGAVYRTVLRARCRLPHRWDDDLRDAGSACARPLYSTGTGKSYTECREHSAARRTPPQLELVQQCSHTNLSRATAQVVSRIDCKNYR